MDSESYDVIIIGAGLSGIDAAYRVKTELPGCTWTVLEARDVIGGTWSFFKFPGLRSDSHLSMFGFPWRRWEGKYDIADAATILEYMQGAVDEEGIRQSIQFRHRVQAANWSSKSQSWILDVDANGARKEYRASFIISCSGYYNYKEPLQTSIPGIDNFSGTVVHPQFWPEDLVWKDKRIALIGSGATAITLLPALVEDAGQITMIQRSPNYVFSMPRTDPLGRWIKNTLPQTIAITLDWWRCFLLEVLWYNFNIWFPQKARNFVMGEAAKQAPKSLPVDTHFNPSYKPFDQRYGYTADGEFFKALHKENCSLVTDTIESVSADTITTSTGQKIEADIIITATGLQLRVFGSFTPSVDGKVVDVSSTYLWKGTMLTGVPNMGSVIGSTTNTWTLGADVAIRNLIQVYKHMRRTGSTCATPVYDGRVPLSKAEPMIGHASTYFIRARNIMPRVTGEGPWARRVHALWDRLDLLIGNVTRGIKYSTEIGDKKL